MKKKKGSNNAKDFLIHINVESIGDFPAVEARILCHRDTAKSLMETFDKVTGTLIVQHLKL